MLYLVWVFKDKFSYPIFFFTLIVSTYGFKVIPPQEGVNFWHIMLGVIYSVIFSLISTCIFKTLKEKFIQTIREKNAFRPINEAVGLLKRGSYGESLRSFLKGIFKLIVLIFGVLGLGAAQFCVFGSPVCSFSVGTAIITALFPSFMVQILFEYAQWIILVAIVIQAVGLYFMGCFKRVAVIENN